MARHRKPPEVALTYGQVVVIDGKRVRVQVTRYEDAPIPKIKRRPMKGKSKIKSTVQGFDLDPQAYMEAVSRFEHPSAIHHAHLD